MNCSINSELLAVHLKAKAGVKLRSSCWWNVRSLLGYLLTHVSQATNTAFLACVDCCRLLRAPTPACIPAKLRPYKMRCLCCLCFTVQASYDVSYVCFTCIIGTVANVMHLTGSDGTPWIKFSVRVPTPNSESFTL